MDLGEQARDLLPQLVLLDHPVVEEELLGHRFQGRLGPGLKPVQSAAAHQRREVAAPLPELVPYRRHAEYDVEVLSQLLDVGLVDLLLRPASAESTQEF